MLFIAKCEKRGKGEKEIPSNEPKEGKKGGTDTIKRGMDDPLPLGLTKCGLVRVGSETYVYYSTVITFYSTFYSST